MLGGQTGPFLKKLVVGSESAHNVYLEKVDVYNMYAMSESGFGTIVTVSIFSCSGGNQYGENTQTHTFGQYPIYNAGDSGHLFHFAGSNCCSVGTFGV